MKGNFRWRDLWDEDTRSWKTWHSLSCEYGLIWSDRPAIQGIQQMIPADEIYKLKMFTPRLIWRDWRWRYDNTIWIYKPMRIYLYLGNHVPHQEKLNRRWELSDEAAKWVNQFRTVWSFRVSYKLQVFAWLLPRLALQGVSISVKINWWFLSTLWLGWDSLPPMLELFCCLWVLEFCMILFESCFLQ